MKKNILKIQWDSAYSDSESFKLQYDLPPEITCTELSNIFRRLLLLMGYSPDSVEACMGEEMNEDDYFDAIESIIAKRRPQD